MAYRKEWTNRERKWLIDNSKDFTVKQMSKILGRTINMVYNQLYQLGLDYERQQQTPRTKPLYDPTFKPKQRMVILGHPESYYATEADIEQSLNLIYKAEDLTGEEKQMYNATL